MLVRRLFFVLAALSLAALIFVAGYAAYPLLHQGSLLTVMAPPTDAAGQAEMAKYWQVWSLLERDFYGEKPSAAERTDGAIAGMVQSFADPYTFFVEPQSRELERDQLAGKFGGIGANLEQTEQGYLLAPLAGQPADLAGIRKGDLLLLVDGREITPQMGSDELVTLLRGEVGSQVTLVVRRTPGGSAAGTGAGESTAAVTETITATGAITTSVASTPGVATPEELTFTLTRAEIQTPSIEWRMLDAAEGADENLPPGAGDIGYLRQTIFSERSPAEMRQALAELSAAGAVRYIWDLRGNPGGLLNSAVDQADMWLDEGVIVVEEKAGGLRKTFEATRGELAANAPLAILVDGGSASASEIVAGALHDHGRAQLVGTQTYGKGSVQLIHELSDQSSLHVTNAQWFTPDGLQISGHGLAPDIAVAADGDPLAAAIAALPSVQAANQRTVTP
jgi:carboxyl-terminal processing protease